jgi:nucleoside triphosphate diphosphatase
MGHKLTIIAPLLSIMEKLRDPEDGCSWDVEQNFASIAPYTIEEAYEVADAIERLDFGDLKDELGDLLLQVVFHSQMAAEAGHFTFADVVQSICDKMIRRHPHVFGTQKDISSSAVIDNWEAMKGAERADKHNGQDMLSALDGVALALPALLRAQKIQKRAARTGFDWPDETGAIDKLLEEIAELQAADTSDAKFDEMGDLLFSAVNVARHLGIDAEAALKSGTAKFERRFRGMEQKAGSEFDTKSLAAKEQLWRDVKAAE